MPYGYGSGRGGGRGRGIGLGLGSGSGGGRGFGFRGTSPAWPYVGRGRGGLPRCGYYYGGNAVPPSPYVQNRPTYSGTGTVVGNMPNYASMSKDEELNYMKNQAEAIKEQLEQIDKRMNDLGSEK
jgi:hypothetical protein